MQSIITPARTRRPRRFRPALPRRVPAIARINISQLSPGSLGQSFRDGAVAVVIEGNGWISSLWRSMMANDAAMPWQAPLFDLAVNLVPHDHLTEALGDVYFFRPGRQSYIGRKIEIQFDGLQLQTIPASFRTQHGNWQMSEQMREDCWRFSMAVMRALAPPGVQESQLKGVRAVIQHLRYHDTMDGHKALCVMARNSLGGWARVGYGLDRRREEMRGLLGRRGISDALALLSLIPPLRVSINGLNRLAGRFDKRGAVTEGYELLSKAHIDTRYFSALCGSRRNLRTEVFVDGQWLPLPINSADVVVLPGMRAQRAFGIPPTLHRVLQAKDEQAGGQAPDSVNVTILLGAK